MSTLHDRIRAVVEERLRLAKAAGPDNWEPPGIVGAYPEGAVEAFDEDMAFMRANDPTDAILSAEHALGILERHRLIRVGKPDRWVCIADFDLSPRCAPGCCPEILALATRWRVEVDG